MSFSIDVRIPPGAMSVISVCARAPLGFPNTRAKNMADESRCFTASSLIGQAFDDDFEPSAAGIVAPMARAIQPRPAPRQKTVGIRKEETKCYGIVTHAKETFSNFRWRFVTPERNTNFRSC